MRSRFLLSRLAYTLCIRSPNVGASRMAYLCRPLLDGPHVFSQEVAVWVDRFGLRTRTSSTDLLRQATGAISQARYARA